MSLKAIYTPYQEYTFLQLLTSPPPARSAFCKCTVDVKSSYELILQILRSLLFSVKRFTAGDVGPAMCAAGDLCSPTDPRTPRGASSVADVMHRASMAESRIQFMLTETANLVSTELSLPVLLYGCETLYLTSRDGHRLRMFENRVLRKIFGPMRDEVRLEKTA
jgi:hypothetical protein